MSRVLLAGLLGGIVLFVWGAFSHMVLPLGEMGISRIQNEDAVATVMKANISEAGFYFIPGMDKSKEMSDAEQQAWTEKYKAGPYAILVYSPTGGDPMAPSQFISELVSDILASVVVAFVVSIIGVSLIKRAGIISLLGLFAWLSLSVSYWAWYKFPTAYILGEGIDQVVGWFVAGLAIAWMLRRTKLAVAKAEPAVAVAGSR